MKMTKNYEDSHKISNHYVYNKKMAYTKQVTEPVLQQMQNVNFASPQAS